MNGSLRLGKILGIDIRLHYSWFLIFAFVTFFVYTYFVKEYSAAVSLIAGLIVSSLFFASVIAHELAHSLFAIKNGIPVSSITLFILGGVAHITREAKGPGAEMAMAIAGPLCSLLLGIVFGAVWLATGGHHEDATRFHDLVLWLSISNLGLAAFNLLPGFPLDGGRVLRAILWQTTKDYRKASRIASLAGQVIGWSMFGGGMIIAILNIATDNAPFDVFDGVWFAFIGWFLSSVAASSYKQLEWHEAMQGITAATAMTTDFVVVPENISLRQLVDAYVLTSRYRNFVVATEGKLQGMVTLDNITRIPQNRWDITTTGAVMTPARKIVTVTPEEEGFSILEKMESHRLDEIPVVRDNTVIGMVSRDSLIRLAGLRTIRRT